MNSTPILCIQPGFSNSRLRTGRRTELQDPTPWMEGSCGGDPAGARQATRLRRRYLQAVLRQEAAFFDASAKSGALLQGLNEDTSAIQLAIGEKVSHLLPPRVVMRHIW